MKLIIAIVSSLFFLSAFAQNIPECKNARGEVVPDSRDYLQSVARAGGARPQVLVSGVVRNVLPEDHTGSPHQKFVIEYDGIELSIVSNLDFGRIPVKIGDAVRICGEYLNVGQGMVHWTHHDPAGRHPNGFTVHEGVIYGM